MNHLSLSGLPQKWPAAFQPGQPGPLFLTPVKHWSCVLAVLLLSWGALNGQVQPKEATPLLHNVEASAPVPPPPPPAPDTRTVYWASSDMPRFPGCEHLSCPSERKHCSDKKLNRFIYDHLRYPQEAVQSCIEGIAVVQFIVCPDGSIVEPKVVRDPGFGMGQEALRVIQLMIEKVPHWTSGQNEEGQPVKLLFNVPVRFKLDIGAPSIEIVNGHTIGCFKSSQINPNLRSEKLKVDYSRIPGSASPSVQPQELSPEKPDTIEGPVPACKLWLNSKKKTEEKAFFQPFEEMPELPVCQEIQSRAERKKCADKVLLDFLYSNLCYPYAAYTDSLEGTVVIQFQIDADGRLITPRIARDIGQGCGEEALRVVRLLQKKWPYWIPGKQRGRAVRVTFILPFKFRMDGRISVCPPARELLLEERQEKKEKEQSEKAKEALSTPGTKGSGTPRSQSGEGFRLFPNPATTELNITVEVSAASPLTLYLIDALGDIRWSRKYDRPKGFFNAKVGLIPYPPGSYILAIEQDGYRKSQLFIKQ